MQRLKIAVLRGGPSSEYDVSLRTGENVLRALNRKRYEPIDVVVTKSGEWLLRGIPRDPHFIASHVDGVFIALHGTYGEDGQVQRLLERTGVPYTGSGPFASAIAMNKALTKDRLRSLGIQMPRHMIVGRSAGENVRGVSLSIRELFGPKYVVKPIADGSSVGVAIVSNVLELEHALRHGLKNHEQLIVEEYISGKEATCGVVEGFRNQRIYTLPAIEIVPPPSRPFFDYHAKYSGETEEICPGRFSSEEKQALEHAAARIHEALGLSHYSRSDFIVGEEGIYFLEVNTLPGLTSESLMPKALTAVGCSYEEFIDHLLTQAFGR